MPSSNVSSRSSDTEASLFRTKAFAFAANAKEGSSEYLLAELCTLIEDDEVRRILEVESCQCAERLPKEVYGGNIGDRRCVSSGNAGGAEGLRAQSYVAPSVRDYKDRDDDVWSVEDPQTEVVPPCMGSRKDGVVNAPIPEEENEEEDERAENLDDETLQRDFQDSNNQHKGLWAEHEDFFKSPEDLEQLFEGLQIENNRLLDHNAYLLAIIERLSNERRAFQERLNTIETDYQGLTDEYTDLVEHSNTMAAEQTYHQNIIAYLHGHSYIVTNYLVQINDRANGLEIEMSLGRVLALFDVFVWDPYAD